MPHRRVADFDAYQLQPPAPIANRSAVVQFDSAASRTANPCNAQAVVGRLRQPARHRQWRDGLISRANRRKSPRHLIMMILEASHTHLYPGHRGKISGVVRIADIGTRHDCVVEFVDGSAAVASIVESGGERRLRVDAYRTAAGTRIAAKHWLVRVEEDTDGLNFRILAKATAER